MMRSRLLLLPLLAALAALAAPAQAGARTGRCVVGASSGPTCKIWTGKVDFVADGDTIDVDVKGDGTSRPVRVRITGLNAMEQSVYSRRPSQRRGECHALPATRRVDQLVRRARGRVRLAAQHPSSHSRNRSRRSVAVRIGGRWVDVAATLLREGHALWLPNKAEWAWNHSYRLLALEAAQRGRNLWNPTFCGAGPAAPDAVSIDVNWDADGNDHANPNGEWVRVSNDSSNPISLAGWWVRDSDLRRFTFPAGTTVAPHDSVYVHVGDGRQGGGRFYWGQDAPAFENATEWHGLGDGGYLFDPQGDLRAWQTWG